MPSSGTTPEWYQAHYQKPHGGQITLFILAAGRYLLHQPPSLPKRLACALKDLLPQGGEICERPQICLFSRAPTVARMRTMLGIGVILKVKILCAEEAFLQQLEIAGFQLLPPNVDIGHF